MPPRNGVAGWLRGLGWLLLLAAVGGCLPRQDQSASSTAPSNPPSGTSTDQPVASGTPRTSSADEIFDRVSPSVVFVATDIGTGSGLIVDDRHVVTNAHVVRPYAAARVRFGDGREVTAAPVVGWDLIADLAVLDVGLGLGRRPLMVSDAMPRTGARVYLVGYPLADMTSPTATITEGIISSAPFEWIDDLTFLQTDATIDDGQSGGVLVDADGRLLGITGASRGQFATAFEAHDGLARIDGLLAVRTSTGRATTCSRPRAATARPTFASRSATGPMPMCGSSRGSPAILRRASR
jgi:S1-C subfamily serine protease